jgi:hypothetical protein
VVIAAESRIVTVTLKISCFHLKSEWKKDQILGIIKVYEAIKKPRMEVLYDYSKLYFTGKQ